MHILFRILIATVVAAIIGLAALTTFVLTFNLPFPEFSGALTIISWGATYKALSPKKKKQQTFLSETYHSNGTIKERGHIIYGNKEGEWKIFNEEGEFIKTEVYENDQLRYTKGS